MPLAPVRLDGSMGEGGGQILRTALFLSVLLRRPFRVDRIRAGRREPGLKPQHVGIIRILEMVTGSTATGVEVGSSAVAFEPSPPRPGEYAYDVGTAGSIPLVLQTMLPVALLSKAPLRLHMTGGTDVTWGPTADWLGHVLLPRLRPLAGEVMLRVERRGFYPRGGGLIELAVDGGPGPDGLGRRVREQLATDRSQAGRIIAIAGTSLAHESLRGASVAERQAQAAREVLIARGLPEAQIRIEYVPSASTGTSVTLWARDEHGNVIGSDGLGAVGRRAEDVGRDVAERLADDVATGATVDRHLADHLVPWVALGAGPVRVPLVTDHLTTNIEVCRAFLGVDCVSLEDFVLRPAR